MLGIDRDLLWRKLFAFDHQAQGAGVKAHGNSGDRGDVSVDALRRLIQDAVARGQQTPLRHMLVQRLGYWVRTDVTPPFWRYFRDAAPLLADARTQRAKQRRAVALYCAEQLTLALQFAEEAFAHCVQIASLFDSDECQRDGGATSDSANERATGAYRGTRRHVSLSKRENAFVAHVSAL